jgi:hypothetical protein
MTLFDPLPETVPHDELAATLDDALLRLSGGPARSPSRTGVALAAPLYAAGYSVVRQAAPRQQLML